MLRTATRVLGATVILALGSTSRAEHAKITLDVSAGEVKETAHVDQTPPAWGKNPRPVLKVKAGESVQITWRLKNVSPHGALKNVSIHLPEDSVIADKFDANANTDVRPSDAVPTGWMGLDIGPKAVGIFSEVIKNSKMFVG